MDRGHPSDDLLKVQLNIISNEQCNEIYPRFQALKDGIIGSQFCAGHDNLVVDTCSGDSGNTYSILLLHSSTNHIICIYEQSIKKSKSTDSFPGGPVQIATPNSTCTYHLIGITSFGMACGSSYGVYTRISEYLDWIESVVWEDQNL